MALVLAPERSPALRTGPWHRRILRWFATARRIRSVLSRCTPSLRIEATARLDRRRRLAAVFAGTMQVEHVRARVADTEIADARALSADQKGAVRLHDADHARRVRTVPAEQY